VLPVLIVVTIGGLYWFASRSVYFPSKYPDGLWDLQARLGATDVWLQADSGVRLHAWLVKRAQSRLITLFFHGNAGNITHRFASAQQILSAGSSILMIDYRGYGKSSGFPTENGLYADAQAAYDYLLRSGYQPPQIVIHGESLGTSVAIHLASRRRCAALILEAPFSSAQDVARTVLPFVGPLVIHSFDSLSSIGAVTAPKLFIHGDRDDIVPIRLGQKLFEAAHQPKTFWAVPGAGHNDLVEVAGPKYRETLHSLYSTLP
jgi:fermentation-respiration switch protein FrsA (DUF1100 family)